MNTNSAGAQDRSRPPSAVARHWPLAWHSWLPVGSPLPPRPRDAIRESGPEASRMVKGDESGMKGGKGEVDGNGKSRIIYDNIKKQTSLELIGLIQIPISAKDAAQIPRWLHFQTAGDIFRSLFQDAHLALIYLYRWIP